MENWLLVEDNFERPHAKHGQEWFGMLFLCGVALLIVQPNVTSPRWVTNAVSITLLGTPAAERSKTEKQKTTEVFDTNERMRGRYIYREREISIYIYMCVCVRER